MTLCKLFLNFMQFYIVFFTYFEYTMSVEYCFITFAMKHKGGMIMYFPINDILNDTILGIPKDDTNNWDSVINSILIDRESEA